MSGQASDNAKFLRLNSKLDVFEHGQCRLSFISGTQIRLIPYNGNKIIINGKVETIPSAGVNLDNTGLVNNAYNFIYVYMNAGVMTLERSTTTYVLDTSSGAVIKNGDATRTLVGLVYGQGAGTATYTLNNTFIGVISWFNRLTRIGISSASGTTSSTTVVELAATGRIWFLSWGDEDVLYGIAGYGQTVPGANSYASPSINIISETATVLSSATEYQNYSSVLAGRPILGLNWVTASGHTNNGTSTFTFGLATTLITKY